MKILNSAHLLFIICFLSVTSTLTAQNGYNPTGKFDTVKAKLLVTNCDTCKAVSMIAYAKRSILEYFGDTMGQSFETQYNVVEYLLNDRVKRKMPKGVTVWKAIIEQ